MWFWNLLGWVLGISVFALLLLSFLSWLSSKASKKEKNENKKEIKKDGEARTDLDYYSLFKGIAVLVIIGVLIYEALK